MISSKAMKIYQLILITIIATNNVGAAKPDNDPIQKFSKSVMLAAIAAGVTQKYRELNGEWPKDKESLIIFAAKHVPEFNSDDYCNIELHPITEKRLNIDVTSMVEINGKRACEENPMKMSIKGNRFKIRLDEMINSN